MIHGRIKAVQKKCREASYYSVRCTAFPLQAFRFSDHRMQQTAGHGLWLSFLQCLVLLNGCLHSVLLISWDHADAGLHGSHWATTAWEEGLHGGRGLHKSVADSSFLCPNCAQLSSKGINDLLVFTTVLITTVSVLAPLCTIT